MRASSYNVEPMSVFFRRKTVVQARGVGRIADKTEPGAVADADADDLERRRLI